MNKLIYSENGFLKSIQFYADFSDENNVQIEVEASNIQKKYHLDKKQSKQFVDKLLEFDVSELEKDYAKDVHIMDLVETNLVFEYSLRFVTSHWVSGYEPTEIIKPIVEAIIIACPELAEQMSHHYLTK